MFKPTRPVEGNESTEHAPTQTSPLNSNISDTTCERYKQEICCLHSAAFKVRITVAVVVYHGPELQGESFSLAPANQTTLSVRIVR